MGRRRHGVLVRFADDLVVMCRSRSQAEAALARLTALLAELGLEPKAAKTRIVQLEVGGEGFDFLGFHHRLVRSRGLGGNEARHCSWPAGPRTRPCSTPATGSGNSPTGRGCCCRSKWIVEDVNRFLRGWAAYFRFGNSARPFDKIRELRADAAGAVHRQTAPPQPGLRLVGGRLPVTEPPRAGHLDGIVVAPRPFRAWRVKPNAGGERRR